MTLQLDARQRAMLEEMGIRLFLPQPVAEPQAAAVGAAEVALAPPVVARAPAPATTPAPAPVVAAPVAAPVRTAPPAPAPAATGDRLQVPGIELMEWDALTRTVQACRACGLCEGRRAPVFGAGSAQADWMVVGDAPGEAEETQGEPFAGQEGKLLDNMLGALGLGRQERVYVANVLKCRPPANRNPQPEEVAQCEPFLRRQVELLRPKVILVMGRFAVQALLQTNEPLGRLRGRVHHYHGVPVIVTYPPASLLRNLPDKAKAWADLCLAQAVRRTAEG